MDGCVSFVSLEPCQLVTLVLTVARMLLSSTKKNTVVTVCLAVACSRCLNRGVLEESY